MADEVVEALPLFAEFPEEIRARILESMNAGLSPGDPMYQDDTPGAVMSDVAGLIALEMDRIYDRMNTEFIAATNPITATGARQDQWLAALQLPARAAAVAASGEVRFTGAPGTSVPAGFVVSTEAPAEDVDPVEFATTSTVTVGAGGTVTAAVQATEAGSAGNVPAASVTFVVTPGVAVTVTNLAAMTNGADVESDERVAARINQHLAGTAGGGNADFYVSLLLGVPGVGGVTVEPNTPSSGAVRLWVTDVNGDPISSTFLATLQALIDPSATSAQGLGAATIGADVEVATPTTTTANVVADVSLLAGYSLDGSGATINVTAACVAALEGYVNGLRTGADVQRNRAIAALLAVEGIDDVPALTINGTGADLAIAATATAQLGTVTLT